MCLLITLLRNVDSTSSPKGLLGSFYSLPTRPPREWPPEGNEQCVCYTRLAKERRSLIDTLSIRQYKKEYEEHFAQRTCTLVPKDQNLENIKAEEEDASHAALDDVGIDHGQVEDRDSWYDLIDPQLLGEKAFQDDEKDLAEQMLGVDSDFVTETAFSTELEDSTATFDATVSRIVAIDAVDSSSMRLHSVANHVEEYRKSR